MKAYYLLLIHKLLSSWVMCLLNRRRRCTSTKDVASEHRWWPWWSRITSSKDASSKLKSSQVLWMMKNLFESCNLGSLLLNWNTWAFSYWRISRSRLWNWACVLQEHRRTRNSPEEKWMHVGLDHKEETGGWKRDDGWNPIVLFWSSSDKNNRWTFWDLILTNLHKIVCETWMIFVFHCTLFRDTKRRQSWVIMDK